MRTRVLFVGFLPIGQRQPLVVGTRCGACNQELLACFARLKRLARKPICLSTTTQMHAIVLGVLVNRSACGRAGCKGPSPLVNHSPLVLHGTQRRLEGLQVQARGLHRPGLHAPAYRMLSTAVMARVITCGAKRR
jgi:hypothetical protein